jgi:hypothetical protein
LNDFRNRVRPDWPTVLERVETRSRELGTKGVVAFDLDSTLFDNRTRQARIVREFGTARGLPPLAACRASDFTSGWDLRGALLKVGLPKPEVERIYPELKRFWEERFFTSDYCVDDVAVRGAAAYVTALARTGVQVCYVTGRHEGMRHGTVQAMAREGLPVPEKNIRCLMKPSLDEDDDDFKRRAHATLSELGTVIAAFDNEPIHASDYQHRFPQALVVHLATDHSGRDAQLPESVPSIPHFARPAVLRG